MLQSQQGVDGQGDSLASGGAGMHGWQLVQNTRRLTCQDDCACTQMLQMRLHMDVTMVVKNPNETHWCVQALQPPHSPQTRPPPPSP